MAQDESHSLAVEITVLILAALVAGGAYFFFHPASPAPQISAPATSSFQRIPLLSVGNLTTENYGYHITNGQIVCATKLCGGNLMMVQADASTFAFLYPQNSTVEEPPYTADKTNVYCDGKVLPDADPNTFEVTSATWSAQIGDYSTRTAQDSSHTYSNCHLQ